MLVTEDLYYTSRGISLKKELEGTTDNPSNEVNIFLINQEAWLKNFVKLNYEPCNIKDQNYIDGVLREALLYQIDYILLQGNKSILETNLNNQMLAPNAYMVLKNSGLANIPHNTQRIPIQTIRRW